MTSKDANGVAPASRPSFRRDDAVGRANDLAEIKPQADLHRS